MTEISAKIGGFVVYIHKDLDGDVFYIGKGSISRSFDIKGRNKKWNRHTESLNGEYTVEIHSYHDDERSALTAEKKLIESVGPSCNIIHRRSSGAGTEGGYKTLFEYSMDEGVSMASVLLQCGKNSGRNTAPYKGLYVVVNNYGEMSLQSKETIKAFS